MPVTVAFARSRDVSQVIRVIGNVEAYSTISVKAQIGGELTEVYFREGDFVKKGDLLFTIDPRPYEAALRQEAANVARDQGALAQARATLARDQINLRYQKAEASRYAGLLQSGVISKDQSEQLAATADATAQAVIGDEAAIQGAQAQLKGDRAAVDQARVQLSYTSVLSPLDGRTGSLNVDAGNLLAADGAELMTINQISPIYVTFSVPESDLGEIKRHIEAGQMPVKARTQGGAGVEESGILTFIDNTVDTTTGTIKLKGTFPNTAGKLWPGQFVSVGLQVAIRPHAVVVPNQAIQPGPNGTFVYVVRSDRAVEVRPVSGGLRVDQDMVIDRGLSAGEMVITEGQLRLTPDSRVAVRNESAQVQEFFSKRPSERTTETAPFNEDR